VSAHTIVMIVRVTPTSCRRPAPPTARPHAAIKYNASLPHLPNLIFFIIINIVVVAVSVLQSR